MTDRTPSPLLALANAARTETPDAVLAKARRDEEHDRVNLTIYLKDGSIREGTYDPNGKHLGGYDFRAKTTANDRALHRKGKSPAPEPKPEGED